MAASRAVVPPLRTLLIRPASVGWLQRGMALGSGFMRIGDLRF
jgi:hypothetical protein